MLSKLLFLILSAQVHKWVYYVVYKNNLMPFFGQKKTKSLTLIYRIVTFSVFCNKRLPRKTPPKKCQKLNERPRRLFEAIRYREKRNYLGSSKYKLFARFYGDYLPNPLSLDAELDLWENYWVISTKNFLGHI